MIISGRHQGRLHRPADHQAPGAERGLFEGMHPGPADGRDLPQVFKQKPPVFQPVQSAVDLQGSGRQSQGHLGKAAQPGEQGSGILDTEEEAA